MLCVVATCWKLLDKFETSQTSEPTSANISIVSRSSKRGPTMLSSFAISTSNNVALVHVH